ncbi:histidinol-phosphatase HisJ family protein [Anaeromicrobium sediminis]|uniref:Histidinol-phosphatase n=1 Tax=Anaeromicrobium sediminis TaxID=1478221 RepID=A0A267MG42_9FIRM|nr:histidinol-phosphatase HisJ family protein [Anaeromicrobium sediminis]PAB57878.1 hypothetical protein CCE28_17940 [Anaeromicrobium sediminis]
MKNIIDHHVHTDFSADSTTPPEEIIHKAKSLNLSGVMFTDHVDYDYPDENINFGIDYSLYMKKLEDLRKEHQNMKILMGVEIGYQPHIHHKLNELLNNYPFDFVIASLHTCDGNDFYRGDFFKGRTKEESYRKYFEGLLHLVKNYDNYDVLGHFDFIIRYVPYEEKKINYEDFKDIIDEILMEVIKKNKGIEVNTSGIRYNLEEVHPSREILKRYLELGGEIVTIGSDAHYSEDLCRDFDYAINLLKELGYKRITLFEKRKPNFIDI